MTLPSVFEPLQTTRQFFYSEKHRICFLSLLKVASTATMYWFSELLAVREQLDSVIQEKRKKGLSVNIHTELPRLLPHACIQDYQKIIEFVKTQDYFSFTVVRNPYKRMFSLWTQKVLEKSGLEGDIDDSNQRLSGQVTLTVSDVRANFEDFVVRFSQSKNIFSPENGFNRHWIPQTTLLRYPEIPFTLIAKLENPQELNDALENRLGPDIPPVLRQSRDVNASQFTYRPEFFTDKARELILRMYAADFEAFDYDRSLPPVTSEFCEETIESTLRAIIKLRMQRLVRETESVRQSNRSLRSELKKCRQRLQPATSKGLPLQLLNLAKKFSRSLRGKEKTS